MRIAYCKTVRSPARSCCRRPNPHPPCDFARFPGEFTISSPIPCSSGDFTRVLYTLSARADVPIGTSLRTFGVPAARSSAKSLAVCIASRTRAVPTPAASRRSARFGEIRACSWMTRRSVTLEIPSRSAASPTDSPSSARTSSRSIAPGCTGFFMSLTLPSGSPGSRQAPRRFR